MRRRIAPAIRREGCEATPKARTSARAVLAKLLRHRVLRERNRVGLVGGVELHLARRLDRHLLAELRRELARVDGLERLRGARERRGRNTPLRDSIKFDTISVSWLPKEERT